jgi:Ca-activated chloride channel homolog
MKRAKFARYLIALLFIVGQAATFTTVFAQSGRRPVDTRPRTVSPGQHPQPNEQQPNRPLVDNTPEVITDDNTIKVDTAMVTIPVSVLDRVGRFVPDLQKRDFKLFEDGVEQQIESFESVETPFNVVLVLDTSASTRFRLEDIQDAAVTFTRQLRRDDRVMVVSFDERVYVDCEFTNDRETLRRAIFQTRTGGNTKLYDAMDLVLEDALSKVQGRKAVVLFSDGVDTASRYATARSSIDQAEESGSLVFPIHYDTDDGTQSGVIINGRNPQQQPPIFTPPWPRRRWPLQNLTPQFQWPQGRGRMPGSSRADYARGRAYMEELADRSGGRLYHADTLYSVSSAFTQIAEELRHQYALSYYPTNPNKDGNYRQVKVRVNQGGLVVRARDGYRAVDPTQPPATEQTQDERRRPPLRRRQWTSNW